jgi:hypothetical protein
MEERRKIKDRRVNGPKQCLPLYYARNSVDRRKNLQPKVETQSEVNDFDILTPSLAS